MTDESQIPEPTDSGADGEQQESKTVTVEVASQTPFPIVQTVQGLAATKSRAFGNEITSALVAGVTGQLARELEESKTEVRALRGANEKLTSALSESSTKTAVLKERIVAYRANRHLGNVGILIGTALLGGSLQLYQNDLGLLAVLCGIAGSILVLFGWFNAPKGDES